MTTFEGHFIWKFMAKPSSWQRIWQLLQVVEEIYTFPSEFSTELSLFPYWSGGVHEDSLEQKSYLLRSRNQSPKHPRRPRKTVPIPAQMQPYHLKRANWIMLRSHPVKSQVPPALKSAGKGIKFEAEKNPRRLHAQWNLRDNVNACQHSLNSIQTEP